MEGNVMLLLPILVPVVVGALVLSVKGLRRDRGTIRSLLFTSNCPISETMTPSIPANRPRSIFPFDRAAITVSANKMIKNFSTEPKLIATFASTGVNSQRQIKEKIPPNREETIPILSAFSP